MGSLLRPHVREFDKVGQLAQGCRFPVLTCSDGVPEPGNKVGTRRFPGGSRQKPVLTWGDAADRVRILETYDPLTCNDGCANSGFKVGTRPLSVPFSSETGSDLGRCT